VTVPVVLFANRRSPSVRYRPYLDTIGATPFLQWWAERCRARHPASPLYVVCYSVAEEAMVRALSTGGVQPITGRSATPAKLFAEIATALAQPTVVFVYYGFAFAPPDLLPTVLEHHERHNNDFTPVLGLPRGVVPEVFCRTALEQLGELNAPSLPTDAATLTMRLVAADATLAGDGRPPLTAIPLDGARWYRTNPSDLPEDVTLVAPRHMAVANDVVTRSPDRHPEPLGDLMCWRRASMERSRDRCRQLAPAIPPRRSVRQGDGPRRVLYVSNQSGFSGAEESLCQLIDHLDRARYEPVALLGATVHSQSGCGTSACQSTFPTPTGSATIRLKTSSLSGAATGQWLRASYISTGFRGSVLYMPPNCSAYLWSAMREMAYCTEHRSC
jgi:hypothetical protein